jgi:hypothetical protein
MNVNVQASEIETAEPIGKPASKLSTYARAAHGIVYVLGGGDTDGYWVTYTQHEKEFFCRPDTLTPWSPLPGESVVEAGDEDCIAGVVEEVDGSASLVRWPGIVLPQIWKNSELEPAWAD